MTINEILQPLLVVYEWFRTYQITLGEFSFTFMDLFVWGAIAYIVLAFIFENMGH